MPTARFKSEPARQEFIRNLVARGFKQIGPRPRLSRLPRGTFRVYEYLQRHCVTPELRVSYYEAQTGPRKPVTEALDRQGRGVGAMCGTPGHRDRRAICRGLCSNCYQRWYYWKNAEFRKKRRMKALKRKGGSRAVEMREAA